MAWWLKYEVEHILNQKKDLAAFCKPAAASWNSLKPCLLTYIFRSIHTYECRFLSTGGHLNLRDELISFVR